MEKPLIKLFSYENNEFKLQNIVDDYESCSFEHSKYEAGQFTIDINFNIPNSRNFEKNMFVQFGNDSCNFGIITSVTDSIGSDGKGSQLRKIVGYDARYIFKRRIIKSLNNNGTWTFTGPGELCMRKLIDDQCGESAETKRQLPITNVISEINVGNEYTVSEAYSNLYDVLVTIATKSETGWRICLKNNQLNLEMYSSRDISKTVKFDTDYDSLSDGQFEDSSESFANTVYVGGKGSGDNRDLYEGETYENGSVPSGLDRFEAWDDAGTLNEEADYKNESDNLLSQYNQTIALSGNGLVKCPFVFKKDYDVGDIITVAFSNKTAVSQILSITEHWAWGAYNLSFEFGKPVQSLDRQLQTLINKIQTYQATESSTSSIRYYTIPTESEMPSADVTLDVIGFVGNVDSGATFKLYFTESGTGAKTYHVYFKQLSGTGKLTLTTGVEGATNLQFSPGTYVAIIYVDANGNIGKVTGATSTSELTNDSGFQTESEVESKVNSATTNKLNVDGSNGTSAGVSTLINKLPTGDSDPVDGDYYVAQYANGGTTNTAYYRRPVSKLWNYIKSKIIAKFVSYRVGSEENSNIEDMSTATDYYDNRKIPLQNITVSEDNGGFRWLSLSTLWSYFKSKCKNSGFIESNGFQTKVFYNGSYNLWRMIILGKCPEPGSTATSWGNGWHIDGTMLWSRSQGHNSSVIKFHATAGYAWTWYTGGALEYELTQSSNSLTSIAIGTFKIGDTYYIGIKFYQSMALNDVNISYLAKIWDNTDDKFLTCVDKTTDNATWFDSFVEFPNNHRWNRTVESPTTFKNGLTGTLTGTADNVKNGVAHTNASDIGIETNKTFLSMINCAPDGGTKKWWHILQDTWTNTSDGWKGQIAFPTKNSAENGDKGKSCWYRYQTSSSAWSDWERLAKFSDISGGGEKLYTYIVKDDNSFMYFISNGTKGVSSGGNDFTSVFIEAGDYYVQDSDSYNVNFCKSITGASCSDAFINVNNNITFTNLKSVSNICCYLTEESFNTQVFYKCENIHDVKIGSEDNIHIEDFFIECENINNIEIDFTGITTQGIDGFFNGCTNISNVILKKEGAEEQDTLMFISYCKNISNVYCDVHQSNYMRLLLSCEYMSNIICNFAPYNDNYIEGVCFDTCKKIINCNVTHKDTSTSSFSPFKYCRGVLNCRVDGSFTNRYINSYSVSSSTSSTYACGPTPNGGFNTIE